MAREGCRTLRKPSFARRRLAEGERAREHAAGCEGCTHFLADMHRMAEEIGRRAPRPTAPAEVRNRLFQAIARARKRL